MYFQEENGLKIDSGFCARYFSHRNQSVQSFLTLAPLPRIFSHVFRTGKRRRRMGNRKKAIWQRNQFSQSTLGKKNEPTKIWESIFFLLFSLSWNEAWKPFFLFVVVVWGSIWTGGFYWRKLAVITTHTHNVPIQTTEQTTNAKTLGKEFLLCSRTGFNRNSI